MTLTRKQKEYLRFIYKQSFWKFKRYWEKTLNQPYIPKLYTFLINYDQEIAYAIKVRRRKRGLLLALKQLENEFLFHKFTTGELYILKKLIQIGLYNANELIEEIDKRLKKYG